MTTAALALPYSRGRYLLWSHPEWWAVAVSAAAWLLLLTTASREAAGFPSVVVAHSHIAPRLSNLPHAPWNAILVSTWSAFLAHWPLMIAAMMVPLVIGQLRFVAAHSLWLRRHRAIGLFLFGYAALWIGFGLLAETILGAQRSLFPALSGYVLPASFVAAALWQLTPEKRSGLLACHVSQPLAPSGWRANLDCFRYGLRISAACCLSCWSLMLACAAAGHALWAILIVTFVAWSERSSPFPRQLLRSLALCAAALLTFAASR